MGKTILIGAAKPETVAVFVLDVQPRGLLVFGKGRTASQDSDLTNTGPELGEGPLQVLVLAAPKTLPLTGSVGPPSLFLLTHTCPLSPKPLAPCLSPL